jgi:hypothetical protein
MSTQRLDNILVQHPNTSSPSSIAYFRSSSRRNRSFEFAFYFTNYNGELK